MKTDQVIEGIGNAVAATKPAAEYCFLWIKWDPICTDISMFQLIASSLGTFGTVAAVVVALWVSIADKRRRLKSESGFKKINIVNVFPVLHGLVEEIEGVTTFVLFREEMSIDEARKEISRYKEWAENYSTRREHSALTPDSIILIPERAGLQISHAIGILRAVQISILRFIPETHPAVDFHSRSKISEWGYDMRMANNLIKSAIRYLEREVDFRSLHPAIEEIHGGE